MTAFANIIFNENYEHEIPVQYEELLNIIVEAERSNFKIEKRITLQGIYFFLEEKCIGGIDTE